MSLMNQQITTNKKRTFAYSQEEVLAVAAAASLLLKFNVSGSGFNLLTLGLGVSDVAAWAGAGLVFEVKVGGRSVLVIKDQICTLLQTESIPVDIPENAVVELYGQNIGAVAVSVSTIISAVIE